MKTGKWVPIVMMLFFIVTACQDNPDVTVNAPTGPGGGGASAVVASITVTPSSPAPLLIGSTQTFIATAFDSLGVPITGVTFTWASSSPAIATISAAGIATGFSAGTTDITATSGTIVSNTVTLTVTCAGIPSALSTPTATPNPVSTFGQSSISVTVTDCNGNPVPDGTSITFSSTPTNLGVVTGGSTNPATTVSGTATATFTAANSFGTAAVTATAGAVTSNPVNIVVTAPAAGSIQFLDAVPTIIGVKGSGQVETATIRFRVSDVNGNPVVDGTQVNYNMTGPSCTSVSGGPTCPTNNNQEYISPDVGSSVNGIVSTILHSGAVAGPVLVRATVTLNPLLSTAATGISIGGGVPSASHFHISASQINLGGHTDIGGYDDQQSTLTAYLADRFGNKNVLAGNSISFYTEAGHFVSSNTTTPCDIPGACTTAELDGQGITSVTLTSQGTVPINVHPWLNFTVRSEPGQNVLIWDPTRIFWTTYLPTTPVEVDIFRNTIFRRTPIEVYDPAFVTDATTGWTKIATVIYPTVSYTNVSLTNGTTYYYFAVARDAQGRVADSSIISGTPRLVGNITAGKTINEPSYSDLYELPEPITTAIRNPRDGWVTIIGVTHGEETFADANGNGVYNAGEKFIDTPGEPFLDVDDNGIYNPPETFLDQNQNGIYNVGEPFIDDNSNGRYDYGDPFFIDVNNNNVWDGPNGVWDGPGCPGVGCNSTPMIWTPIKLVFTGQMSFDRNDDDDGSQPNCAGIYAPFNCQGQTTSRIEINAARQDTITPDPDFFLIPNGGCASFVVYVSDANLNTLSSGSTISISNSAGKLTGPTAISLPDGLSTGPTIFGVSLCDSDASTIKTEGASLSVSTTWKKQIHDDIIFTMSVFGIMDSGLGITTTTLPNATQSVAYSTALNAVGGTPPYTWSIIAGALPASGNLTLSAGGLISGTPLAVDVGTYNFTVLVTDSVGGTATQVLTLTIT